jgi:hypothetical protein
LVVAWLRTASYSGSPQERLGSQAVRGLSGSAVRDGCAPKETGFALGLASAGA